MYNNSAGWPAMEDFPYIPARITPDLAAPNPSYTNTMEPVPLESVLHDLHEDIEDQGANASGSKNSHGKHKSLMDIFSKTARDHVSILNGLRASKIRRKNPPKFFCDLCPADFTRKHNLDSGLS